MPTTWEILTGNSTLPLNGVNTAWDHLNNQNGDGGGTIVQGGEPYLIPVTSTLRIIEDNRMLSIIPKPANLLTIKSSLNILEIKEPLGDTNEIKIR